MKRILSIAVLVLLWLPSFCQTKAETRQYDKAVAAGDIKSFDKFLKKYPASVYADDILARKDTILNITPYSIDDAWGIALPYVGEKALFKAVPLRREAVDRIYIIAVSADSLKNGDFRVMNLVCDGNKAWSVAGSYDRTVYDDTAFSPVSFVDSCFVARINRKDCLFFNCLLSQPDGQRRGYLALAYFPETDEISSVLFSGKDISAEGETGYRILGRTDDSVSMQQRPEINLLKKNIDENPRLEKISDADWLTDEVIGLWLENNPRALDDAKRVVASVIPEGCSLIERFNQAKGKQNSSKYRAAMFDFRGYTMVVVQRKSSGDYILAWAEPECRDHNRDRLLNSIEFEDADTIEMFFYQGRKYFKYHYNITSKTIRR